jgi:hypothetical protein
VSERGTHRDHLLRGGLLGQSFLHVLLDVRRHWLLTRRQRLLGERSNAQTLGIGDAELARDGVQRRGGEEAQRVVAPARAQRHLQHLRRLLRLRVGGGQHGQEGEGGVEHGRREEERKTRGEGYNNWELSVRE